MEREDWEEEEEKKGPEDTLSFLSLWNLRLRMALRLFTPQEMTSWGKGDDCFLLGNCSGGVTLGHQVVVARRKQM